MPIVTNPTTATAETGVYKQIGCGPSWPTFGRIGNSDWLAPDHGEPGSGRTVIALRPWVLRSIGRTVLVDTGAGKGRERPGMAPYFHQCQGDFLGLLEKAGA